MIAVVSLAQPLQVYSEFRRVGPSGEIVAADGGGRPREILSPAVARNSYLSMHIFVSVPAGKPYDLHFAQNPDGAVSTDVYRELHENGVPDRLDKLAAPVQSKGPAAYWLDVWIPPDARPGRMRLEAQLFVDDRWIIYPMELRIREVQVPVYQQVPAKLPPVVSRADASAVGAWCNQIESVAKAGGPTVRSLIWRNALQDLALAGRNAVSLREKVCGQSPLPADPEWYLGIRDRLKEPLVHQSNRY